MASRRVAFRAEVQSLEDRKLMTLSVTMLPDPGVSAGQDPTNQQVASFQFTNGAVGDYTATIDWGDGSSSLGLITPDSSPGQAFVSGAHSYASPGPETVSVGVNGDGDDGVNSTSWSVGTGSGSDSSSGNDFVIPDALGQDFTSINNNASPGFQEEALKWSGLMLYGGNPWDTLRPYPFGSEAPSSSSTTSTVNGTTSTVTTDGYVTATVSGSGSSGGSGSGGSSGSGGATWDEKYVRHFNYFSKLTGPDSKGGTVVQTSRNTDDLDWHAWADGSGTTFYKVTEDYTDGNSNNVTGDGVASYQNNQGGSDDSHLVASGQIDAHGKVSGTFTYKGSINSTYLLHDEGGTDGNGNPNATGAGFTVDYSTKSGETVDESGSLVPDATNQGTIDVQSSETGTIALWDGNANVVGATRNDGDESTSYYNGAIVADAGTPGATTGTVNTLGPRTPLVVPAGKNTVYAVDKADQNWLDFPMSVRNQWLLNHPYLNCDPNKPNPKMADKTEFSAYVGSANNVDAAGGLQQVIKDLGIVASGSGPIDVLVFVDHGDPGFQYVGNDKLTSNIVGTTPLTEIVKYMRPGGTLVLAGCTVFWNQNAVNGWQAAATNQGITIIGSSSAVSYVTNTNMWGYYSTSPPMGIWIVLKPGGTPPTIVPGSPPK